MIYRKRPIKRPWRLFKTIVFGWALNRRFLKNFLKYQKVPGKEIFHKNHKIP